MQVRRGGRHQIENATFLRLRRIADVQLKHEAIKLRFGKLIGALLFEWIFRRKNKEWIGERIGFVTDCDLALLHRFE